MINDYIINNIKDTEIKKSPIHGYGLFSIKTIKQDNVLCILDGQFLSYDFIKNTNISKKKKKELEWNQVSNNLLLIRYFPTKYRFINHSRKPNLRLLKNPLRVVTIKEIKQGEELLLDYREEELGDQYLIDHGLTYL